LKHHLAPRPSLPSLSLPELFWFLLHPIALICAFHTLLSKYSYLSFAFTAQIFFFVFLAGGEFSGASPGLSTVNTLTGKTTEDLYRIPHLFSANVFLLILNHGLG